MTPKFWTTDLGKILSHGIHDHNSGLGIIVNYTSMIKKNPEKIDEYLVNILTGKKKCEESIDYIYTKIREYWEKNDFDNKI